MEGDYKNPFFMPILPENHLLTREEIKETMKVDEKKGPDCAITPKNVKAFIEKEMEKARDLTNVKTPGYVEPGFILDLTKDIHRLGEKCAAEYVAANKTILLNNHALNRKHSEMIRIKEQADKLEEDVTKEEERLERDAKNFNNFIQNISSLTDEAIRKMVNETRIKFHKIKEVREIKTELFILNSDVSKRENLLSDYLICQNFLKASKPQTVDWDAIDLSKPLKEILNFEEGDDDEVLKSSIDALIPDSMTDEGDDMQPIVVPFKDASDLLKSIDRFRNQNLSIITNSHYVKSSLRVAQEMNESVRAKMENSILEVQKQIDKLREDIENNIETACKLENLANTSVQQSRNEEKLFEENIAPQVESVYEFCCGVKAGRLNLTMMVGTVESYLSKLIIDTQKLPEKILFKIHKDKVLERLNQKKKLDELRRKEAQEKRALKRDLCAQEPAKLKLERRMMYVPKITKHVSKKKEIQRDILRDSEDDEYFFYE